MALNSWAGTYSDTKKKFDRLTRSRVKFLHLQKPPGPRDLHVLVDSYAGKVLYC